MKHPIIQLKITSENHKMIYSRLVTQTDVFTILTVKWNLKQTQHFHLLLICNVPLCIKSTMEPIQTVTLSLELGLLRKTKLKSEQYKTLSVFPLKKKKKKIKALLSRGWDIDIQEELTTIAGKDVCFGFFAHCIFSHKNHDVAFLQMVLLFLVY